LFPGTRRLSAARLTSPAKGVSSSVGPVWTLLSSVGSVALPLSFGPHREGAGGNRTHDIQSARSQRAAGCQQAFLTRRACRTSSLETGQGQHDAKAHDEGASRESNPWCSRQDSNLHCLSTPGLSRVAKPIRIRERENTAGMPWATGFEPMASRRDQDRVLHHVELHPEHARLVRTPRVELGWDAYKTSWLHRSRVRMLVRGERIELS
jgi:hypothetical protein